MGECSSSHPPVKQKMLSHLVLFGWMIIATSGSVMRSRRSVVMTRVERVRSGSDQCLAFNSCPTLQGRNKQDTLQTIRQLQCGFSGSSPMVCCPASLPRKALEDGGNPAVVNVDVNSRTNLDIGGLNARTGNFPLSREETTIWYGMASLRNIFQDLEQELSFPRMIRDLILRADKGYKSFCLLLSLPFFFYLV